MLSGPALRTSLIALTIAIGLVAAGCGDDNATNTSTTSSGGSATAAAANDGNAMSDDQMKSHSSMADDAPTTPADSTASIELGEFFVKPSTKQLKAGTVKFTISNTGQVEHELQIARKDAIPAGTNIGDMDHDSVHAISLGAVHGIKPKDTGTELKVDLKPGTYILFCDLPGHYASGQHIEVTVV